MKNPILAERVFKDGITGMIKILIGYIGRSGENYRIFSKVN
jgi:hypothetical protein